MTWSQLSAKGWWGSTATIPLYHRGLVVTGGSCSGVGRSSLSAASTCFSKSSPDWEMKDDTLQSNCHHCIGYTTNKWPPAWIIWWITVLTCPSGNYFCLLKNSADLKWVEIVHPFLISLLLQVEPKFYFSCSGKMSSLRATAYLTVLTCLLL